MNAIETHPVSRLQLTHLRALEAEAIHILRETAAQFERPVLLYSIGKDSSVMLHLARKAFFPGKIPFPLLHIDTGYEYPEMIAFRDWFVAEIGAQLITRSNQEALSNKVNPYDIGTARCCALLRTQALVDALKEYRADATLGGARRDEERARAKDRVFSFRDSHGQWDPKRQRPELWSLDNGRVSPSEHIRVFPLSNWTELDVWSYIVAALDDFPADQRPWLSDISLWETRRMGTSDEDRVTPNAVLGTAVNTGHSPYDPPCMNSSS